MKKLLAISLLSLSLLGSCNVRAADFNYGGAYNGSMAGSMMSAMWDFMEWFLGQRNNTWRNPYSYGSWGNPGAAYGRNPIANNPYRYRDYWDDPYNPWVDMQPLEGTWMAQSGERWVVRGNQFVLVDSDGVKSGGEFYVEGDFILTRMPWGEVEFEYRQMDDVLLLRDVNGRLMLLRRIEAGGWNW